ncbi:MAG: molybdopterin molybdotransferase, partial [Pseudomonadota bacterium]|nr:molybdopterin molybdotransferase [Pseudomonadota bacterium]
MTEARQPEAASPDSCAGAGHGDRLRRLDEAREHIIADVVPVTEREVVSLRDALGRVLASAVHSTVDVPSYRSSAMDGYALAGQDLPSSGAATFELVGRSLAGRPFAGRVGRGQCVRIMTGAPVPEAADTVVMQEQVCVDGNRVVIAAGQRVGQHVRPVGEDIHRGDLAIGAGTLLHPAQLGMLAAVGVGQVPVLRRVRVATFSTGDELRPVGEPLALGQIYDSNRYSLCGMLARLGLEVIDLGVVPDTREDTLRAFESAATRADAIVTSGGVSVGEADYVTETLERHGRIGFWKVAIKPGKPIAFGRFGSSYFFGLPGNPVAVMVTFYQLVQPALLTLMGAVHPGPPILVRAVCGTRLRKQPG